MRGVDAARLLTQLGVPPNLQSLTDGLRRTEACLARFPSELDICLRAVPGDLLEAEDLLDGIRRVLEWMSRQPWGPGDPRSQPMQRPEAAAPHPLYHYCVSVLFHWGNLFYALEPGGAANPSDPETDPFESLMAEFSAYVIAAQATIDPARYLAFCGKWYGERRIPDRREHRFYPTSILGGRVGKASLAVRRLSLIEHRDLFQYLIDPAHGNVLHERVFSALQRQWGDRDKNSLEDLARLLEEIRPGWQRPGGSGGRRSPRNHVVRGPSQHRTFRDGYVRIPEQDAVRIDFVTEEGMRVEHFQPRRLGVEAPGEDGPRAGRAISHPDADIDLGTPNAPEPNPWEPEPTDWEQPGTIDESPPPDDRAANDRVEAEPDGTEWIPVGEQQSDGDIDAVVIEPAAGQDGQTGSTTSQWAADHKRRYQLALGLSKDRLTEMEAHQILRALAAADPQDGQEALVALHACLSLGRPIEQITGLEIHVERAHPDVDARHPHYFLGSQQWIVGAPAPAWTTLPPERIERPQLRQLWLGDRTGFARLLGRFGMAVASKPFQKLTRSRQHVIDSFLKNTLPRSTPSLARCGGFLFYHLLSRTHGDIGIASLITGQEHSHSRSVRHYANYAARRIWNAYGEAWRIDHSWRPATLVSPAAGSSRSPPDRGYGAKRVPTLAAVRSLISLLARGSWDREGTAITQHNSYTTYTLAGMVLGLAMRPVIEPQVTGVGDVAGTGLLVSFLDKARSDYDRRVNPVPLLLSEHLRRYTSYRSALTIPAPANAATARFLYLDPASGKPTPFRPSHFQAVVGRDFPLEPYALRRFVRSELEGADDVEAEDVDAYMGHWLYGASPFDRLSTYPMRRLHDFAAGPVSQLLTAVGFQPLDPPLQPQTQPPQRKVMPPQPQQAPPA